MELLLQAIDEKLSHVDTERNKWLQYKEEHINADSNLREFQKSLRKDVLVPIGSKALIPGQLYHTNEIFVASYQGLFVKCSTAKALAVCQLRIDEANRRLQELGTEHQMFKDRMDLPVKEGVFASGNEIIEEYDEEEEKKWREKHKVSVREHKKAEAEERKRLQIATDIDIDEMFAEAELREELERELEKLSISDDEQLQQHIDMRSDEQGEMSQPKKQDEDIEMSTENDGDGNIGEGDGNDGDGDGNGNDGDESKEFLSLKQQAIGLDNVDKMKFYEIHLQKLKEYFATTQCTIHNFDEFAEKRVTEENIQNAIEELEETDSENETKNSSEENQTESVEEQSAENQSTLADNPAEEESDSDNEEPTKQPRKFLTLADCVRIEQEYEAAGRSKSELIVYFKSQLRIIVKSIAGCSLDVQTKNEKREVYGYLTDRVNKLRIEIALDHHKKTEEDFVDDDDVEQIKKSISNIDWNPFDESDDDPTGKRKISFASEPDTVTFRDDDEPCVLSQYSQENLEDDIDADFEFFNTSPSSSMSNSPGSPNPSVDMSILDDLDALDREEDYESIVSTNDCDLRTILRNKESTINAANNGKSSQTNAPTLILKFDHSSSEPTTVAVDDDSIHSPLDIYRQFGSYIEASTHTVLSPRTLGRQLEVPNIDAKPQKSILKNRNEVPVVSEPADFHVVRDVDPSSEDDAMPEFTQVLGDIVERSDTAESSSTLPGESQSGSESRPSDQSGSEQKPDNQPKKRVSLFKKSRM